MNTRDERRRRHLFLLMGVSLLAAAAFSTIVQTVPAAWAGEGAGALPAKAPALETHHRGEPLDVLFLLPPLPHREAFLVRFSAAPDNEQVVLYVLRGSQVTEFLERSPEFPSFLRENGRLDLVGWINDRLGIPVHHIVEVKQRCWPQYPSNPHVEPTPLLELAAAFPGKLTATLPPAPNISTDLFKGSLETDPGLVHVVERVGLAATEDGFHFVGREVTCDQNGAEPIEKERLKIASRVRGGPGQARGVASQGRGHEPSEARPRFALGRVPEIEEHADHALGRAP